MLAASTLRWAMTQQTVIALMNMAAVPPEQSIAVQTRLASVVDSWSIRSPSNKVYHETLDAPSHGKRQRIRDRDVSHI